jgi:DNA-binding helix-hairpin-helix protein with protein kinase domain
MEAAKMTPHHRETSAPRVRLATGEPIDLTPVLARAGEGIIYGTAQHQDWAAKVFHPTLKGLQSKLDKVAAMIDAPPPGALQPNGFVVLTWPTHVLVGDSGPVGFVMPRIDTATSVEIHTMSNPVNRQDPRPSEPQWTRRVTWEHLVNTAANLCLAVQVVHRVNAVIGDFQERNILVSDTTQVALVDCDSMQFTDRSGRQYLCAVGRPEFTAPELAGVDLRVHSRGKASDLFALAVHIHQLLMAGNHPFMRGVWTKEGEQPDALSLARSGAWAGGRGSPLQTHPLAPPITFLPLDIQRLFERAFAEGAVDPSVRPSADEWRGALLRIDLTRCSRGAHQVPVETVTCPWCGIDDEREVRRSQKEWSRPAMTGARSAAAGGHPGATSPPIPTGAAPATGPSVSTKLILTGLVAFVVIVVALTSFIVWAILSGASSFGS